MLHLITGTPGAGKTLYAVSLCDKYERENKANLPKNPKIYAANKKIIAEHNLFDCFKQLVVEEEPQKFTTYYFQPDDFDIFEKEERFDEYYSRTIHYNEIIKNINAEHNLKLKDILPVRTIYADIKGLQVDNIRVSPEDWRTTPQGSVIFYDEIQQRATYKAQRQTNDIIERLQVHRHKGYDIYGITQFPVLIHQNFRAVVGEHYHLHRGWGMPSATVYLWAYCVLDPNTRQKKAIAERDFRFNYPKRLYEVYKSATVHTHKLRIPKKALLFMLFPLIGIAGLVKGCSGNNFVSDIATGKMSQPALTSPVAPKPVVYDTLSPQQRADLTAQQTSTAQNQTSTAVSEVKYDPNKPFDNQFSVRGSSQPYLSGCIQLKTKCSCYTQQGSRLDVSIADCKKVISDGMPFNPFLQQSQTASISPQSQANVPVHTQEPTPNV